jgi:hypothetical protein
MRDRPVSQSPVSRHTHHQTRQQAAPDKHPTDLSRLAVYRMAAPAPPYARPEIVRGQQCAEAPLGRRRSDRVRRPQQHGSASQRRRGARMSGCYRAWSPHPRPPSACPASTRPASGVRGVSSVRPPGVRPSGVRPPGVRPPGVRASGVRWRCLVPGVRRPVSGASVRILRPASVSTLSAPVSLWSAWAAHTDRDRPGRHVIPPCSRPARRLPGSEPGACRRRVKTGPLPTAEN